MENASEIINNLMAQEGFRRKRDVAEYFGVSPQALSLWIAKGEIPPKHLLKLSKNTIPDVPSNDQTSNESKTVIDYLMKENVSLKQEIEALRLHNKELKTPKAGGDLLDRVVADTLLICGRVTDGVITEVDGKWKEIMGYEDNQLVGRRYDREDLIHPDELTRVRRNQNKLRETESIAESRYSTIQRWKHGVTGNYVMLSMIWDVNVTENIAIVICKAIDAFVSMKNVKN
tara:strand:+ start:2011 stop:2700 length:690 start_codon:yes stop_codon:yes gene_type:complete